MKKLLMFLFISGCGAPYAPPPEPVEPEAPGKPPVDTPSNPTFAEDVQPLMQKYCAQCHNDETFISQEDVFLTSKAPVRIANGSMPLKSGKNAAQWGAAQKAIVAKFVQQNK